MRVCPGGDDRRLLMKMDADRQRRFFMSCRLTSHFFRVLSSVTDSDLQGRMKGVRTMKRGLIFFLAVLFALAIVLPGQGQSKAAEPLVWIPEYCGFRMGTIEFSLWVENEFPLTSMAFDLLYDDTAFSGPGVFIDERAHGCFMYLASIAGGVRISVVCDSIGAGSGPLISFRFDEPDSLECRTSIDFTVSNLTVTDSGGHLYERENLTASLPVRYLGDVTGDCEVNVIDALAVANFIISLPPPLQGCVYWAMDVNYDDRHNILDVLAILDIVLGYGYPEKGRGVFNQK
jgi:hypothetical protein